MLPPPLVVRIPNELYSALNNATIVYNTKSNCLTLNNYMYKLDTTPITSSNYYQLKDNLYTQIPVRTTATLNVASRKKDIKLISINAQKEKHSRLVTRLDESETAAINNQNRKEKASAKRKKTHLLPTTHTLPISTPRDIGDVRQKLVHILAVKPRTLDFLANLLKVDKSVLSQQLNSLASLQWDKSNYQLNDAGYKLVTPYEWSRYDFNERQTAIKNAGIAFKNLKLPETAPEWKNIQPREQKPQTPSLKPPPIQPRATSKSPAVDPKKKPIKKTTPKPRSSLSKSQSPSIEFRNHSTGITKVFDSTRGGLGPIVSVSPVIREEDLMNPDKALPGYDTLSVPQLVEISKDRYRRHKDLYTSLTSIGRVLEKEGDGDVEKLCVKYGLGRIGDGGDYTGFFEGWVKKYVGMREEVEGISRYLWGVYKEEGGGVRKKIKI